VILVEAPLVIRCSCFLVTLYVLDFIHSIVDREFICDNDLTSFTSILL
jgi:hypothetical protein